MLNKLSIATLAILTLTTYIPAYADDYSSCSIEVAVATPPVNLNETVIFNVTNERGTNNAFSLKGGSAPHTFTNLICSNIPYNLTATIYASPSNGTLDVVPGVGQCSLKAGVIVLNGPENSASVVFPYDFNCNVQGGILDK